MVETPDNVRHYWRAARQPFLNLSDLDGVELEQVIGKLGDERSAGESHRVFGRRYMDLRQRTEEKMRQLFVAAGGEPQRAAPHYFVLGRCRWFEQLAVDMQEVVIPLDELPTAVTSITYPDSFTAMGLLPDFGLPYEAQPYHERVFRLEDLDSLVAEYGMPVDEAEDYDGYEHRPFEFFIEVQLWSDQPIRQFLGGST